MAWLYVKKHVLELKDDTIPQKTRPQSNIYILEEKICISYSAYNWKDKYVQQQRKMYIGLYKKTGLSQQAIYNLS